MYTKILMQIVLLAYFSENISLPVKAAKAQVPEQSVKNTADDIIPKINLQSDITNSAAPASSAAITQTLPKNQQVQTISNINKDTKIKIKPESTLTLTTPESIKKGADSLTPTPGVPSAIGLLNDDPNYEYEEVEEMDDDEDEYEPGELSEENHNTNNPTQNKQTFPNLSSSKTTKPKGVYHENINQGNNNLLRFGTLNNNENGVNIYEEEEEEEEEDIGDKIKAEQQPTSLQKNPIGSIKENINKQYNSLSKSGPAQLDTSSNDREEDQEYSDDENSEEPWRNDQIKPYSWPSQYQKEHDNFQQHKSLPPRNTVNKYSYSYEDEDGQFNVGSAQQRNKQDQSYSAFNVNNEHTNNYEISKHGTDNNYGKSVKTNEFQPQQYNSRQSYGSNEMESEELNSDDGSSKTEFSDDEKVLNGYKTIKKILYLLHDFASSTFNWIINKINSQIEKVEVNRTDTISAT